MVDPFFVYGLQSLKKGDIPVPILDTLQKMTNS